MPANNPIAPWRPLIIAHRGARDEAPENTPPAFDRALRYPIDAIELDVQLTADHEVVLFHDQHLFKVTGRRHHLCRFDYPTLNTLDWGAWYHPAFKGLKLPTLKKVLETYLTRTSLMVEIKSHKADQISGRSQHLTREVVRLLSADSLKPYRENAYILSFDPEVLKTAYQLAPDIKYILNLEAERLSPGSLNEVVSGIGLPRGCLHGLCLAVRLLSEERVKRLRDTGKGLFTYSCNTHRQVYLAHRFGCDGVMTDRPGWLINVMGQKGWLAS